MEKALYADHLWMWDFVNGWSLKGAISWILSVANEYTHHAHCSEVARHIISKTVQTLMEQLIEEHGAIEIIRLQYSHEFIGRSLEQ